MKQLIGYTFIFVSFCLHLLNIDFGLEIFFDLYTNSLVAFIFYCIFQHYPKKKNDKNSIEVLNQLTSSIYEAFITQNIFSHGKHAKYINTVTSDKILNLIKKVKNWDFKNSTEAILSFKFALETAGSNLCEFENVLTLANNVSSLHSLEWLNLTHELRLFADEYKNYDQFNFSNNLVSLEALKTKEFRNLNKEEQYFNVLETRFITFLEVTIEWKNFCRDFKY